ncbi:hypothetical protein SAMN05216436_10611 [bacterium A37T11]|nr:hypothetical protein SAMN05216436_10611 [bacterium A37T11]
MNINSNQETGSHSHRQTKNIDRRKPFSFPDMAPGNFEIVL